MKSIQRALAALLSLLFLLSPLAVQAQEERGDGPVDELSQTVAEEQAVEGAARPTAAADEALFRQIEETYAAAKQRARRRSFKGYCGAYVANQLMVLGINTSYLSANGNNTYDIYKNLDCTTGGYRVSAYGAKEYTLSEALEAIMKSDPSACNILVGFQRGASKSSKKYGHVLFIHGVRNGRIYFSDSSARTVEDVTYREGEPIVCSLAAFLDQYANYTLDGVIHFIREEAASSQTAQASMTEETASTSPEKTSAVG